jgi:diaminopimelate decarboxylase
MSDKKRKYEKPIIVPLRSGLMNKFGTAHFHSSFVKEKIDEVKISDLVEKFGSPLFVFSEKTLRKKYRKFKQAFSSRYPNVQLAWSYKTNYLKAICATLHQEGAWAEVVSGFEYQKAKELGVKAENIIFNGPYKPEPILRKSLLEGALVNIDNLEELLTVEKIAQETGKKMKIGMRVNLDAGIYPRWSKFGFNLENYEALNAVKRMSAGDLVELRGIHCHLGTFILKPEAYELQVKKILQFANQIEAEFGFQIEYFDFGGGFPSKSRLKGIYLPPDVAIPSIDTYAEKITSVLYSELKGQEFPKVFFESGRAIVDEAGYLITTIFASKRLPDSRKGYFVDAGVNLLFTSYWYNFNVKIDRPSYGLNEPSVIYGPLCMNIDVISESISLPPLEVGTRLILWPIGAYNVTQSMQFIEYRPNVV